MRQRNSSRLACALLLIIPLGFLAKYALAPVTPFGRFLCYYGAAVFYEVFWVLVLQLVFVRWPAWRCGVITFLATCALEFTQRWHAGWLERVRATLIGQALLGSVFDPNDFFAYLFGSLLGVALLHVLCRPDVVAKT